MLEKTLVNREKDLTFAWQADSSGLTAKPGVLLSSCYMLYFSVYCRLLPLVRPRVSGVEFALHPQHETSYDSGIQLIEDFNYFESNSGKRPRSL